MCRGLQLQLQQKQQKQFKAQLKLNRVDCGVGAMYICRNTHTYVFVDVYVCLHFYVC